MFPVSRRATTSVKGQNDHMSLGLGNDTHQNLRVGGGGGGKVIAFLVKVFKVW